MNPDSKDIKAIIISNKSINSLARWLFELELMGSVSRQRTRFIKILSSRIDELERERIELAEKYAKKDPETKQAIMITKGDEQHYDIAPEDLVQLNKDLTEIYKENFLIDIMPSNVETLKVIRDVLLDTDQKIGAADAIWYDDICEAFEAKKEDLK